MRTVLVALVAMVGCAALGGCEGRPKQHDAPPTPQNSGMDKADIPKPTPPPKK